MADEPVRKLPKTSTPSAEGKRATDGASTPKGGGTTGSSKPKEVAKLNMPSAAGKGPGYRPVDQEKWAQGWARRCLTNPCVFRYHMCIYCSKLKPEDPEE